MTTIRRRQPVDWFRVLAELRRAGLSQCAVARIIQVPRNRLKEWANGKSPRYDDGRALLMLWRRACYRNLSPKRQSMSAPSRHDDNSHPSQR